LAGVTTAATFVLTNIDFTLAPSTSTTVQITPGTPANVTLNLTITPAGSALPADVNYSCAVPTSLSGTTCTVSPARTMAGSTSGGTVITITSTASAPPAPKRQHPVTPYLPWATATLLAGLMAVFLAGQQKFTTLSGRMAYLSLVLLAIFTAGLVGCTTAPAGSTLKGPNTVTVMSTSEGVTKTTTININWI
jgi:hypothetical protein